MASTVGRWRGEGAELGWGEDIDIDPKQFPPRSVLAVISDAKNNLQSPEQLSKRTETYRDEVMSRIYEAYEAALHRANAVDFDDLLLHTATLLADHPEIRMQLDERFQYLLVDEYQDTNMAQYTILRALSQDYRNLAATGDPDQSIFGWAT